MTGAAVLRPAAATDLPAILAIWTESTALHGEVDPTSGLAPGGPAAVAAFLAGKLGNPEARLRVAGREGEVAA